MTVCTTHRRTNESYNNSKKKKTLQHFALSILTTSSFVPMLLCLDTGQRSLRDGAVTRGSPSPRYLNTARDAAAAASLNRVRLKLLFCGRWRTLAICRVPKRSLHWSIAFLQVSNGKYLIMRGRRGGKKRRKQSVTRCECRKFSFKGNFSVHTLHPTATRKKKTPQCSAP